MIDLIPRITRRCLLVSAAAVALFPRFVFAQAYPTKPVRWIVPYPPGGGSDFLARTVGAQMEKQLGQPLVIENRPGAATMIGAEAVARGTADGYTLLSGDNGTFVFNTALYKKVPYDPTKDFAPVGLMARFPLIVVANPSTGFKTMRDLVDAAKKDPGKLSYASVGAGSPHHLAMELIKTRTGAFIVHIPYRGAAPAVQDVLGNQLPIMVIDTAVGLQHIRAGKLVPLGVLSRQRLAALPNVPTLEEQGIRDTEVYAWQGMAVPAATPREVIVKLSRELNRAITTPEVTHKLQEFGLEPISGTAEQMAAYIKSETARWHALIKQRNLTLD
ncbi:MAG TPA: tripartite tricarboxylate transporter substrate binding protein [Burkholderiaceae bacterium]|nr:tripartite tricarboxylate transporter substrate binding protein [Burkholderiaceae bacterium]